MANEKTIQTRVIQKHDVEANWLKATNFSPKQGEIIIYDIDENYDYERMKIGDGVTNVNDLPFVAEKEAISINDVATGEIVKITEASPLEHEIKVKLSNYNPLYDYNNDGVLNENDVTMLSYYINFPTDYQIPDGKITDVDGDGDMDLNDLTALQYIAQLNYSTVTLTKYGKNRIDQEKFIDTSIPNSRTNACVKNENGNFYIEKSETQSHFTAYAPVSIQPNTTFTISLNMVSYDLYKDDGSNNPFMGIHTVFTDGTGEYTASNRISTTGRITLKTLTYDKEVKQIRVYIVPEPKVGSYVEFNDFQVELGSVATEYEPYKEPVSYTPNADGTVDGVTSFYPTTIFMTDNANITIEAEYIKNVNEAVGVEPSEDANSSLVVGANIFNVLRFTKQTLTNAQKAQVIENLGLADYIRSIIQEESETVAQNYLDTTIAEEASW